MSKKEYDAYPYGSRLGMIKCECGEKFLLVPDLAVMSRAIEAHVLEHFRKEKDPKRAAIESERIWNVLIASVFAHASQ